MSSHDDEGNLSGDDSAPEAVSFDTAKSENIENLQRIKEQVNYNNKIFLNFFA